MQIRTHSKIVQVPILSAVAISAGFAGYLLGRGGRPDGLVTSDGQALESRERSGSPGLSSAPDGRASLRAPTEKRTSDSGRKIEAAIGNLGATGLSGLDFESLFQVWQMAGNMDADRIRELLVDIGEKDVGKEALMAKGLLANRFGAKGGAAALEYFLALEDPHERSAGFNGAMVGWMRESPDAAYEWLRRNSGSLDPGIDQKDLTAMYFSIKSADDYAGAVKDAAALDKSGRLAAFRQLAEQAATDPDQREKLIGYLNSENDPALTRKVERDMIEHLAIKSPAEAMEVIGKLDLTDERRAELEKDSLNKWSGNDPQGATQWQKQRLSGKEGAGDLIADSFRNWINRDEAAASNWLRAQGDEFRTDLIFQKAGETLQHSNPARAAQWQAEVRDDDARRKAYRKLYNRWRTSDLRAADAWRESLPAADRAALTGG